MRCKNRYSAILAVGLVLAISGAWTSLAAEEFKIITTSQLKQWLASS